MKLKSIALWALASLFFIQLAAITADAQEPAALKTEKDKVSYAIGVQIAASIKGQGLDIDPDMVSKGFKDVLSGGKPLMSEDELRVTLTTLQQQMKEKQMQAMSKMAADNKKTGDAFLAENGKKEGVTTLPSGIEYKVIKAGTGPKPAASDTVLCNYRGTFIDGTEFDSSLSTRQPAKFPVGGVIPGFKEVLQLMPTGSKWQIVIPASLAYGENGAGDTIGPNSTLIFEVELVSIEGKP